MIGWEARHGGGRGWVGSEMEGNGEELVVGGNSLEETRAGGKRREEVGGAGLEGTGLREGGREEGKDGWHGRGVLWEEKKLWKEMVPREMMLRIE